MIKVGWLCCVGASFAPEAFPHFSGWSFNNELVLTAVSVAADSASEVWESSPRSWQTSQCCLFLQVWRNIPNQGCSVHTLSRSSLCWWWGGHILQPHQGSQSPSDHKTGLEITNKTIIVSEILNSSSQFQHLTKLQLERVSKDVYLDY